MKIIIQKNSILKKMKNMKFLHIILIIIIIFFKYQKIQFIEKMLIKVFQEFIFIILKMRMTILQ